jgi:hypothetical protein
MQLPHNIEKAAFPSSNKAYIGYGRGLVWRIRKSGTGGWEAFDQADGPHYERALTLEILALKITDPLAILDRYEEQAWEAMMNGSEADACTLHGQEGKNYIAWCEAADRCYHYRKAADLID